jgi:hypothetical protein
MITYTWRICGVVTEPSKDGSEDFVSSIQWQVIATDNETQHSAWTAHIWQSLTHDPAQSYVPRHQLTDDLIASWIKKILGDNKVAAMEAEVASRIPPAEQMS